MIKKYFITDASIIGSTPSSIEETLPKIIEHFSPDFICLRDKESSSYEELAKAFLSISGKHKALLHSNVELASELGAYGVHLTSLQFDEIDRAKAAGLFVIASTHTLEEIALAKNADAITYSPVFHSPGKGNPKGLADLKEIVDKIKTKIFALGGITTDRQVKQVEECGVYGFASIRYFKR